MVVIVKVRVDFSFKTFLGGLICSCHCTLLLTLVKDLKTLFQQPGLFMNQNFNRIRMKTQSTEIDEYFKKIPRGFVTKYKKRKEKQKSLTPERSPSPKKQSPSPKKRSPPKERTPPRRKRSPRFGSNINAFVSSLLICKLWTPFWSLKVQKNARLALNLFENLQILQNVENHHQKDRPHRFESQNAVVREMPSEKRRLE